MNGFVAIAGLDRGRWDHMDGWGWMGLWGVAMMLLFVALIIWAVRSTAANSQAPPPAPKDPNERAREILAARYAQGELTTEEFRERAEHLR